MQGHSDARVLSQPHPVHFAGFQTTTTRLQQAGWQLSVEQDFRRGSIRLAMRYEPARLYMLAEQMDFDYFRHADMGSRFGERPIEFHIRHCAAHMTVQLMESTFDFQPIDAAPQFTTAPRKSIEDFGIFATPMARTEEIIVEPATVAELLEKIKAMQAPELAEIRKRNARRNELGAEAMPLPATKFHAQILSIAA